MKRVIIALQTLLLKITMLKMIMMHMTTLSIISPKKMMRKRNYIPTNGVRDIF